jgi:hypothetical protein
MVILLIMLTRVANFGEANRLLNVQWEMAVMTCLIGLMFYMPMNPWNFNPGMAFRTSKFYGESMMEAAKGGGGQAGGGGGGGGGQQSAGKGGGQSAGGEQGAGASAQQPSKGSQTPASPSSNEPTGAPGAGRQGVVSSPVADSGSKSDGQSRSTSSTTTPVQGQQTPTPSVNPGTQKNEPPPTNTNQQPTGGQPAAPGQQPTGQPLSAPGQQPPSGATPNANPQNQGSPQSPPAVVPQRDDPKPANLGGPAVHLGMTPPSPGGSIGASPTPESPVANSTLVASANQGATNTAAQTANVGNNSFNGDRSNNSGPPIPLNPTTVASNNFPPPNSQPMGNTTINPEQKA